MEWEDLWDTLNKKDLFETLKGKLQVAFGATDNTEKKFELESQDLDSCWDQNGKFCFLYFKEQDNHYKLKIDVERPSNTQTILKELIVKKFNSKVQYWDNNQWKNSQLTSENFDSLTSSKNRDTGPWDQVVVKNNN